MQYWLMKSEPDEVSIDDALAAPGQTVPWTGVRNYQARNFLRDQVALDDEVLLYHSHCKQIGVVGTARVVKTAYADPTQFNPESDYYDPKASPDAPRWFSVDICLQEKFPRIILLAEIKQQPQLAEMVLLRQGRLSIQPVTPKEWKTIVGMQ